MGADRRTDQALPCPAELMRAISRSQSCQAACDGDSAALMRLANDPLLLSAFLQRAPVAPLSGHACCWEVAAGLVYRVQVEAVSFREAERPRPVRLYLAEEPSEGTSHHAFAFMPNLRESYSAWDSDELSFSGKPIVTPRSRRYSPRWLYVALAGAILAFTMIIGFF